MSGAGSEFEQKHGLGKALQHVDLDGHDLPPSPAPSSPHSGRRYAFMTELVHSESKDQYNASSTPIYQVWPSIRRQLAIAPPLERAHYSINGT